MTAMDGLKNELSSIFGTRIHASMSKGSNQELCVRIPEETFMETIRLFAEKNLVLLCLFCVQNGRQGFTLFYLFEKRGYEAVIILERLVPFIAIRRAREAVPRSTVTHATAVAATTSISRLFPSAVWYEREIMDGFGMEFPDALDKRRLFLHEAYPDGFHPLLKAPKMHEKNLQGERRNTSGKEYMFKEVVGEGVYQIPVGPVHAGIIEPGHFRFSVIGEIVFNLEVRMFYKHRGIEKLAEGKTPAACVPLAEAMSGDESVANGAAFCFAVEKISGIAVPRRAQHLRMIYLELERAYSLLGDLAGMILDVAYPSGASRFFVLREELLRWNERLTGSRFLKGALCIGGVQRDVRPELLAELTAYLPQFVRRFKEAKESVLTRPSIIDRFETTGVIKKEIVAPLNLTGPIARASGVLIDTRRDHPYGLYADLGLVIHTAEEGDVLARFKVKAAEILDAVGIVARMIREMPAHGLVRSTGRLRDGSALSLVESARGQNLHWVLIRSGRIVRYKVRTASFCNWQAIEHAVPGNIVPDFPLINKSLNLSYAGTDL